MKGVKGVKKRAKREGMSGYNCFTKNLYAAEKKSAEKKGIKPKSYGELLKMKTWGTLQDRTKSIWNDLAKQGCPSVPDPQNI